MNINQYSETLFLPVQVFSQQFLYSSRVEPLLLSSLGVTRNLLILLVELQIQANVSSMLPTGTTNNEDDISLEGKLRWSKVCHDSWS